MKTASYHLRITSMVLEEEEAVWGMGGYGKRQVIPHQASVRILYTGVDHNGIEYSFRSLPMIRTTHKRDNKTSPHHWRRKRNKNDVGWVHTRTGMDWWYTNGELQSHRGYPNKRFVGAATDISVVHPWYVVDDYILFRARARMDDPLFLHHVRITQSNGTFF